MNIFYNSLGDFQWASIAAIIAGVGAISSFFFSFLSYKNSKQALKQQDLIAQKNIDANLKAKSRLEWIKEVRRISADYISTTYEVLSHSTKILQLEAIRISLDEKGFEDEKARIGEDVLNDINERADIIGEKLLELINMSHLLDLYFAVSEENKPVHVTKNWIMDNSYLLKAYIFEGHYREFQVLIDKYPNRIKEFTDVMQGYLKREWDRAKEGK